MRGGAGAGGKGTNKIPKNRSIAPTPARRPRSSAIASSRRESDASLCSNRLSSASLSHSLPCPPISDRSYQSSALRSVNSYLTSISSAVLRPPLPSARDITKAFDDVLSCLDYTSAGVAFVIEDDLPFVLSSLRCPIKLSKSALKAPGTPHSWPPLLGALHWLVQLARSRNVQSDSRSFAVGNEELRYTSESFTFFMEGDDDAVEALDQERLRVAEEHVTEAIAATESMEKEVINLEKIVEGYRSGPSPREVIEKERALLRDDIKKFDVMIESWKDKLISTEKLLKEKEEGLEAKIGENQRISKENEELRTRIASQVMNVRDAERMKKELQAVERDVVETEIGRNILEEKSWELDADINRKMRELESLVEQANYTIKKLKLGCDFQYSLSAEGSSAADVLGKEYKTVLKPFISDIANETKKNLAARLEEKISLQQRSRENSLLLDERKKRITSLRKKIDDAETRSISLKREVDEHISRCSAEAEEMVNGTVRREHQIHLLQKEAENFVKECEGEFLKAQKESEEKLQTGANELLGLIDSVSEFKEFMEAFVEGMLADLSGTAQAVVDAHKSFFSSMLIPAPQSSSLSGSTRAHAFLTDSRK